MGKISLHVRTVIRTRDDAFLLRKSEDTGKEVVVVKKGNRISLPHANESFQRRRARGG